MAIDSELQSLIEQHKKEKLEYLRNEIEHNAIYRVRPGNNAIPGKDPNRNYIWQIYLRRCLFNPNFTMLAAELLIDKLSDRNIQIGACEDAGVPLGLAMSALLKTPMISIKKQRKSYGLLNFTEGTVTGKPILLVDDLAGSQATLRKCFWILNSFKLPIANQYATIMNKTQGTHTENYLQGRELISLFSCDDFAMSWQDYVKKFDREPDFGSYY